MPLSAKALRINQQALARVKAGKSTEFGALISASCFEGYVFNDRISWDNFNESGDLLLACRSF